jgi:hypothetical protein
VAGRLLPRVKATGPPPPCLCGRPFTTRGGKANHARHCAAVMLRDAAELARVVASIERARARTATRTGTDP